MCKLTILVFLPNMKKTLQIYQLAICKIFKTINFWLKINLMKQNWNWYSIVRTLHKIIRMKTLQISSQQIQGNVLHTSTLNKIEIECKHLHTHKNKKIRTHQNFFTTKNNSVMNNCCQLMFHVKNSFVPC